MPAHRLSWGEALTAAQVNADSRDEEEERELSHGGADNEEGIGSTRVRPTVKSSVGQSEDVTRCPSEAVC